MIKYSSGLISESFWFVESKKIINLLMENYSWVEIKTKCIDENLLGAPNQGRATRMFGYLKNRIIMLDDDILELFIKSDITTQKLIVLISIMEKNCLFFEFIYEIYRDKIIIGNLTLEDKDIMAFFRFKQVQDNNIDSWTDATLKRLKAAYFNFMIDSGLLTVINKEKTITPPIIDINLENYLKNNNKNHILKAITGVI